MRKLTTILATAIGIGVLLPASTFAVGEQPSTQSNSQTQNAPDAQWGKAMQQAFEDAFKKMLVQLKDQANQNDPEAQLKLGMIYDRGMFVEKDPKAAEELYKKAFKPLETRANQGDPVDQLLVGMMYEKGMGVSKDEKKGQDLYDQSKDSLQKLADDGDTRAIRTLGWKYEEGLGVGKDPEKAQNLYKKAAEIERGDNPAASPETTQK
jgi:TPR repeat protein